MSHAATREAGIEYEPCAPNVTIGIAAVNINRVIYYVATVKVLDRDLIQVKYC